MLHEYEDTVALREKAVTQCKANGERLLRASISWYIEKQISNVLLSTPRNDLRESQGSNKHFKNASVDNVELFGP